MGYILGILGLILTPGVWSLGIYRWGGGVVRGLWVRRLWRMGVVCFCPFLAFGAASEVVLSRVMGCGAAYGWSRQKVTV